MFDVVLLGFGMIFIGLLGAVCLLIEEPTRKYIPYWIVFWVFPPLIKFWFTFVLS